MTSAITNAHIGSCVGHTSAQMHAKANVTPRTRQSGALRNENGAGNKRFRH